jgi:hypothetical protein
MFRVNRKDIHYLRTTLEAYDGMAVVRTVDPREATIELLIAPGCEESISSLLAALRDEESIPLDAAGLPVDQSDRNGE